MARRAQTGSILRASLSTTAVGALAIIAILVPAILASAARAETTAEAMYRPSTVDVINLTLPPASVKKLEEEPEAEYVEGTFSLAETDGTPQSVGPFSTPITVGIRLKGSLGSLRTIHEKAAFKIKLNYVKGQKFAGLKKMTLNNMVQDPSMVHETLAYELFRADHVPGPHTGFAYLYVNGENFGLHLNIETMDDVALEKRFGEFQEPPQHLYEGEYGADVTAGKEGLLEVDEGEEGDRSDLEALVDAVTASTPADFSEVVGPDAVLQEMVHEWAVEKYIGHWDGYAGQQGGYWPNNYYLFSSAAGVFQMLPWGTDQTWGTRLSFDGAAGVLFDDCLANQSCAVMYRRALRELLHSLPPLELESLASGTAALLTPWQALEESPRQPFSAQQIEAGVEATKSFAGSRPAELEAFLAGEPAEVTATAVAVAVEPGSIIADGSSTATVTATLTGAQGEPVFGDQVEFSSSDPGQHFSPVVDAGAGLYETTVTASTAAGTPTITATDASAAGLSGASTIDQVVGPPVRLGLSLQPSSIVADGTASTTATATVTDADGNPIAGQNLGFSSSDPGEQVGPVVDHGDGTYTARVTASTKIGTATITAADAGLTGSADLQQVAAPASRSAANGPASESRAPQVRLTTRPPHSGRRRRPLFAFVSDQPGSSFECKLDDARYQPCSSPSRLPRLGVGPHTFRVVATGAAGIGGKVMLYRFTITSTAHGDRRGPDH